MIQLSSPNTVSHLSCVVPRLIVHYSRIVLRSPMIRRQTGGLAKHAGRLRQIPGRPTDMAEIGQDVCRVGGQAGRSLEGLAGFRMATEIIQRAAELIPGFRVVRPGPGRLFEDRQGFVGTAGVHGGSSVVDWIACGTHGNGYENLKTSCGSLKFR